MKLDGIYNPDKDTIEITYQENPTCPVQTIAIARGNEHHLRHLLEDMEMELQNFDGWEFHFHDNDRPYDR